DLIIEPAVAIGSRPLVQPGLHPQYPFPRLTQHRPRRTGIHRRLFWHCSILLAIVLPPLSVWPALPTLEYYGDSAPPGTFSRRRACPTGRARSEERRVGKEGSRQRAQTRHSRR